MSDIHQWLDSLGLAEHADVIAGNAVEFRALPALTEDGAKRAVPFALAES